MANPNQQHPWYERAFDRSEKHPWYIRALLSFWLNSNNYYVWSIMLNKDEGMKPKIFRSFVWNIVSYLVVAAIMMTFVIMGWVNSRL